MSFFGDLGTEAVAAMNVLVACAALWSALGPRATAWVLGASLAVLANDALKAIPAYVRPMTVGAFRAAAGRADRVDMRSAAVRTLILALASSALIAAPAVAQDAMPTGADATQEAADEAAERAEEAGSAAGDAVEFGDPSSDPCDDVATPNEDEDPPAAADDPCADASTSDAEAGAGSSSSQSRAAGSKGAGKPISLSIPLLLKRGYATVGTVKPLSAGVVVQELTVASKGKAKGRRIAGVRRVVKRSGRVTLRIAISKPGRKTLRSARTTLEATLRTTITLRSGRSTTIRRAVLLVPGRRR